TASASPFVPGIASSTPVSRVGLSTEPVATPRAEVTVPEPSRVTTAATPQTGYPEAGCRNLAYAELVFSAGAGRLILTSTSSGSIAVVNKSTKNSSAEIVRSPLGPRTTNSAPWATSAAVASA